MLAGVSPAGRVSCKSASGFSNSGNKNAYLGEACETRNCCAAVAVEI